MVQKLDARDMFWHIKKKNNNKMVVSACLCSSSLLRLSSLSMPPHMKANHGRCSMR